MTQSNQPDETREWVFTFGHGQTLPDGTDGYNHFVAIVGTYDTARTEMISRFGPAWAFQYSSRDKAGVTEFDMTQVGEVLTARTEADWATQVPAGAVFAADRGGDRWDLSTERPGHWRFEDGGELAAGQMLAAWGPFRWFDAEGNEIASGGDPR